VKPFRSLLWIFVAFAFIGFLDASYLAVQHYLGQVPPCSLVRGCEVVTTSRYAEIGGVPVALLGSLYYLGMMLFALRAWEAGDMRLLRYAGRFSMVGLAASAWFIFLQLFVLHALCMYCVASAASSTVLFITGMRMLHLIKKSKQNEKS
jgi:uncharacterized membrane protein